MPQQISMIMPEHITTINKETVYLKHLYALEGGLFPATLTGWEADVLNAELDADSLVAWYRNPTGGAAALAIPYRESENSRTLYPDFLFFHKIDGQVVVDLVDPHNPGAADAGPKWLGLARYANLHGDHFRRVLAVIKSPSEQLISLDLKNPDVATYLETASNETDIRHLFEEYGGYY